MPEEEKQFNVDSQPVISDAEAEPRETKEPMTTTTSDTSGKEAEPADHVPEEEEEGKKKKEKKPFQPREFPPKHPLTEWWGKLLFFTFDWLTPLIFTGLRRQLHITDVPEMMKGETTEDNHAKLERALHRFGKSRFQLLLALNSVFGFKFWLAGLFKLVVDLSALAGPGMLVIILRYLDTESFDYPAWSGPVGVVALGVAQLISVFCNNQFQYYGSVVRSQMRGALIAMIYRKSLVLSIRARSGVSGGDVVNMMSIDAARVADLAQFLHLAWTAVVQVVGAIAVLIVLVGWPGALAPAVLALMLPINFISMRFFGTLRLKAMKVADERVKIINEIMSNIRIIKFFGWEKPYTDRVKSIRRSEMITYGKANMVRSVLATVFTSGPAMISLAVFTTYILIGNPLSPDLIFPALAYINMISFPLNYMIMIIAVCLEAIIGLNRMQKYVQLEERSDLALYDNNEAPIVVEEGNFEWLPPVEGKSKKRKKDKKNQVPESESQESAIEMEQTNGGSEDSSKKKEVGKLLDINLNIPKGSLTMVVGAVGSGKSSLLNALLGEMRTLSGKVEMSGDIAYCAQEAWLMTDTLRNNVTFGKSFDEEKYEEIIRVSELTKDLEILANGDQTEIGAKGLNLSGGQRQRVSIARAVYADAELYLLDDILSALDQHVGRSIFEKCITGHLGQKTRLLVTHQLQYLRHSDQVLVMDNGRIVERGTYEELLQIENGVLARLIEDHMAVESEEDREKDKANREHKEMKMEEQVEEARQAENDQTKQMTDEEKATKDAEKEARGKLISVEGMESGSVSIRVYWKYLQASGGLLAGIIIELFFILSSASMVLFIWWLAMWIMDSFSYLNTTQNIAIFIALCCTVPILMFLRTSIFYIFNTLASIQLHHSMFSRVIRGNMGWFDSTPVGRIINRFSNDMELIDAMVGGNFMQLLSQGHMLIVSLVLLEVATWFFIIVLIPLAILYVVVVQLYRSATRDLKRLESIARSPLYSHTGESLTGISTIRAYRRSEDFIHDNKTLCDTYTRPFYFQLMSMRWSGVKVELIGVALVVIAGIALIFMRGVIEAGLVGFGMSFGLAVSIFLNGVVVQFTELEANMNSVERVDEYIRNVPEEPIEVGKEIPKEQWPSGGHIKFNKFVMRYRADLDPVLNELELEIKAGEHIGIVGRTGAGKSSIMLALYRMVEASGGSIEIDGENIADLKLHVLRHALSIIPQDPILFSGTIRTNLDPFNQHTDKELWECLEASHLKDVIASLNGGIDALVAEGGSNFSVGQRQLICLARALVLKSPILILDEATASVDLETDALIQQTIRDKFSHCTTLTIAHRINTVIDADRVLVLSHGQVAEFDKPSTLVMDPNSHMSALIDETGAANARTLRKMALEAVGLPFSTEQPTPGNNEDKASPPAATTLIDTVSPSEDDAVKKDEVEEKKSVQTEEEKEESHREEKGVVDKKKEEEEEATETKDENSKDQEAELKENVQIEEDVKEKEEDVKEEKEEENVEKKDESESGSPSSDSSY